MLLGEHHHNIDDKGRLVIPNEYRLELGNRFVITRGIEKCLYVYSLTEWEKLVAKLKNEMGTALGVDFYDSEEEAQQEEGIDYNYCYTDNVGFAWCMIENYAMCIANSYNGLVSCETMSYRCSSYDNAGCAYW